MLLMGKSTISTGPFSIVFCMFTRGYIFPLVPEGHILQLLWSPVTRHLAPQPVSSTPCGTLRCSLRVSRRHHGCGSPRKWSCVGFKHRFFLFFLVFFLMNVCVCEIPMCEKTFCCWKILPHFCSGNSMFSCGPSHHQRLDALRWTQWCLKENLVLHARMS